MIYQFEIFRNLTFSEKNTFRLHVIYSLIEGIILGVLALNEFIFVRSMKGSENLLSILFSFSTIVLLFSIFFNEFLKRYQNKRKLLNIVGIATRLPLLILIFFPGNIQELTSTMSYHYIFLGIFLVYFSAQPIILPIINLFLKQNYNHDNFGKLYSYSTMLNKIVMLVTTFLVGLLLDADNFAFRYIYPIIGGLGILSVYLLSLIRISEQKTLVRKPLFQSAQDSLSEFVSILKQNKEFRDFEIGFMFYGFAFMTTAVMITLFYDRVLNLNYSSFAFYKNFYNIVAILFLPVFGRLIGILPPRKFAAMTFTFMFFMVLFTALTEYIPVMNVFLGIKIYYVLIVASLSYGLFAGAMPLLWSIGSAYFCKSEDAATYQAIHLSLTGVRGCFAPFIGILIYKHSSFSVTFLLALLSLLIAIFYMVYSAKNDREMTVSKVK
ncbi:MFS transporter [Bacteroidota bacterium]